MTVLLDSNVLIALLISDHVHHDDAETWFDGLDDSFATCAITEGSLVRMVVRHGHSPRGAQHLLTALADDARHRFWADAVPYSQVRMAGVIGHRQVTDAYLAQLARSQQARIATFDSGLAELHGDVAVLVPLGA